MIYAGETTTDNTDTKRLFPTEDNLSAQDEFPRHKNSVTENIILDTGKSILGKDHTTFIDNWHLSQELYLELRKNDTNVIKT